jgi:hypothetical protein
MSSHRSRTLMRFVAASVVIPTFTLSGCVGPAARDAAPNPIQRAKVLSKNDLGITIEHSEWGKPIAFRLADDHCTSLKKAAVYRGGVMQLGPDISSSWRCE